MPGSTARNGDGQPKKSPGSPGLFLGIFTSSFQCTRTGTARFVQFCTFGCRTWCYAGGMSQEKLVLFAILLGFALIAMAALVLVIFLP